jgi:protein gp37
MKNSKINWTTHTFNCWEGCTKVSPGRSHCYAKAQDDRQLRANGSHWGPGKARRIMSEAYWR